MHANTPTEEQESLFPWLFQRDPSLPDPVFYSLQSGLMLCSAVNAAVRLDLATHLQTPKPLEVLAQETQTHAPSLALLLSALASVGIFQEIDQATQTFAHTERSRLLIRDVPGSMADLVGLWGADYQWNCWRDLTYTIQTGQPAIQQQEGPDAS